MKILLMMNKLLVVFLLISITHCQAETIILDTYLGGYQTTIGNKPALGFKFGAMNSQNSCNIITTDTYLRQSNNVLENINLSEPGFYFDCDWNGVYYFLSNRLRTYAGFLIKPPDGTFPMSMHIEAKLVSINGVHANIESGDISMRRNTPN